MFRIILVALVTVFAGLGSASAQENSWVQVEALPDLRTAQDRARAYGTAFPNVNGFRLRTGWYALALGPYGSENAANQRLRELRFGGLIPRDSYIAKTSDYGDQFWPIGAVLRQPEVTVPQPVDPASPAVQTPQIVLDETPRQARASERLLSRDEKKELQRLLQWFDFYTAAIDGSFGRGTRGSMSAWQSANGFEATGILTTRQREILAENYVRSLADLGLEQVLEPKAGLQITMPAKLVEFEKYDPPFVHYKAKDDSGIRVLLISQYGDRDTLGGLYEIMQTLEIVPPAGTREKRRDSFVLTGQNTTLHSHTEARLENGQIKGFTLIYPPEQAAEMSRVIKIMRDSLMSTGTALDASLGRAEDQAIDLLAGLTLRQPKLSRSGVFVDGSGSVLTSATAVQGCARITLDNDYEADLVASDEAFALLAPRDALVPLGSARIAASLGRLRSDIAVSGYSFGGTLAAPTLTYGTLADIRGLDGDETVQRLAVETLEGDIGGPVLDMGGAVAGLLLEARREARNLPGGVQFAARASEVATFLSSHGINVAAADAQAPLGAEMLARRAADMTVLVSCW